MAGSATAKRMGHRGLRDHRGNGWAAEVAEDAENESCREPGPRRLCRRCGPGGRRPHANREVIGFRSLNQSRYFARLCGLGAHSGRAVILCGL